MFEKARAPDHAPAPEELRPPHILLVDNYDSFTYNLYQWLIAADALVEVVRNDKVTVSDIAARHPDGIVVSPGPKAPADAGVSMEVIQTLGSGCPILGVCLGHQCINEVFGGRTVRAPIPWHGKTSAIQHDGLGLFAGIPQAFDAARYHSLVADRAAVPASLVISAWTAEGLVMGLRHAIRPIEGVQFHPESFLTRFGGQILGNFLRQVRRQAVGQRGANG